MNGGTTTAKAKTGIFLKLFESLTFLKNNIFAMFHDFTQIHTYVGSHS